VFASRVTRPGRAGVLDVAFTDRFGGVSPAPFDELDLGTRDGPLSAAVDENFALLSRALGVPAVVTMSQVHGCDVAVVGSFTAEVPTCDAMVTTEPDVALCVRVADCVPVVLADRDRGIIAVAHAGRRGVAAAVTTATVDVMRRRGADSIEAWVGPHVCSGCYEVPAALRAEVASIAPAAFACTTWGTPSLDLGAAVTTQLIAAGCEVSDVSRCTRESPDLYSYRRDGPRSGRSAALVALRSEPDG
jgi:YfiH family protein